jgi:hypothetical protein
MGNLGEELDTQIWENMRELLGAIFIQNQRMYDMMSIIADKLGADAKGLFALHESGQILAPAPSFIFEEDENSKADADAAREKLEDELINQIFGEKNE